LQIWALAVVSLIFLMLLRDRIGAGWMNPSWAGELGSGTLLFVFLTALVCEYVDSSLGMGYGTTLTPLLMIAGFEPLQIVPCVLLSEFLTGLAASVMHHRDGNVDLLRDRTVRKTVLLLSLLSVAGTLAAVVFAVSVPQFWLTAIITSIVLTMGLVTLVTARIRLQYRPAQLVALGAVAAFNKAVSGGGYGPLVTTGQVVSGLSSKQAVAITSLCEALTCAVGLAAYLVVHGQLFWPLALPLTAGALLSVPVATLTVRRMPESAMRGGVGLVTCLLGFAACAKLFW